MVLEGLKDPFVLERFHSRISTCALGFWLAFTSRAPESPSPGPGPR
jgi:hypothetical protein